MRLAVLSDIHSNSTALLACMEYLEKESIDGALLLGDYVSDCPNPQETLSLLRKLEARYPTWMIRGNREGYFLNYRRGAAGSWTYTSYQGSLLYTYERLEERDLDWFASMPESRVVQVGDAEPIFMVHGSPLSSKELMDKGEANTDRYLRNLEVGLMLAGHTHRQFAYKKYGKMLLNPGSVGVAIGVESSAHMAMLSWNGKRWDYELLAVPYDYGELCRKFGQSSLMEKARVWPKCILKSIACGVNVGPICAKRAYDLAVAGGEWAKGQVVPEKYWEEAAREMEIE